MSDLDLNPVQLLFLIILTAHSLLLLGILLVALIMRNYGREHLEVSRDMLELAAKYNEDTRRKTEAIERKAVEVKEAVEEVKAVVNDGNSGHAMPAVRPPPPSDPESVV